MLKIDLIICSSDDSKMSHAEAMKTAGLMVAMAGITATSIHYVDVGYNNANKVRAAVCGLMYKKSLRLSQTALHDTSPGKFVNLLSNDVGRFQLVSYSMHSLWVSPIITALALYFLWLEIQWAAVFGSIVIFTVVPLQSE